MRFTNAKELADMLEEAQRSSFRQRRFVESIHPTNQEWDAVVASLIAGSSSVAHYGAPNSERQRADCAGVFMGVPVYPGRITRGLFRTEDTN